MRDGYAREKLSRLQEEIDKISKKIDGHAYPWSTGWHPGLESQCHDAMRELFGEQILGRRIGGGLADRVTRLEALGNLGANPEIKKCKECKRPLP